MPLAPVVQAVETAVACNQTLVLCPVIHVVCLLLTAVTFEIERWIINTWDIRHAIGMAHELKHPTPSWNIRVHVQFRDTQPPVVKGRRAGITKHPIPIQLPPPHYLIRGIRALISVNRFSRFF